MGRRRSVTGIDEAGRGAVIGPLVLAGCTLTPSAARKLSELGLGDSKGFGAPEVARPRRAQLADAIRHHATWLEVRVIDCRTVDRYVRRNGLGVLEREIATSIIEAMPRQGRIVLDGERLFGPLCRRFRGAEAFDRADGREPAVSAASILAKTVRDAAIDAILDPYRREFGDIGGLGYPNAATAAFLERYHARYGALPKETRLSWNWAPIRTRLPAQQVGLL